MEARAIVKYLKISPYKVRPVINQVRGLPVDLALGRLAATPRKAARFIEKLINSAVANLKGKGKVTEKLIYIKTIHADEGPLSPPFKYRPRARGMANRIRNRTSHITVIVAEAEADKSGGQESSPRARSKKKS